MLLGLLQGLLLAVGLSFLLFVANASRLHVSELGRVDQTSTYLAVERFPELLRHDGILALRPDGGLFFANVDRVVTEVQAAVTGAAATPHSVLLDLGASFRLDQPTVAALVRLRQRLGQFGVELHFVHVYLKAADAIAGSTLCDVPLHRDTASAVCALTAAPLRTDDPLRRPPRR